MSIAVPLEELADRVAERGAGYLLTTAPDRPHVMHLTFQVDGAELRTTVGRSATRNIEAQPAVTLLWPPEEDGGYSLIVDATATVGADSEALITATGAVLHRPA